jgi:CRP-like cAMP-binding protein
VGYSSITARQECRIIYISEEDFKEIIYRFPAVAFNYIQFLTDRIRFLNRKIDTFSAGSTEGKIYEFLLSVCDGDGVVKKNLSMAEIARRLKIGRSSLYRGIDSLEEKGLITRENQTFKVNK